MRKSIVVILNQLNIKKKLIKIILKNNHVGEHCSNPQCLKKITKLNSQPAQYEKNKIDKDNYRKKNKKNHKKTMWGNIVII